jgi:hypothetical protein
MKETDKAFWIGSFWGIIGGMIAAAVILAR